MVDMSALSKALMRRALWAEFVHWSTESCMILLVLNGCGRDCAGPSTHAIPVVRVAGQSVDRFPAPPNLLEDLVLAALIATARGIKSLKSEKEHELNARGGHCRHKADAHRRFPG